MATESDLPAEVDSPDADDLIPEIAIEDVDEEREKEETTNEAKEEKETASSRAGWSQIRVEEYLKLEHLEQLQHVFREFSPETADTPDDGRHRTQAERLALRRRSGFMNRREFKETVQQILGNNECSEELDRLFAKLDTHGDNQVNWEEFVTYLLLYYTEIDEANAKGSIPFKSEPKVTLATFNRQEVTERIIAIENPTRYVSVSKEGAVTVWDPANMVVEANYYAIKDNQDQPGQKRLFKNWVTDMVYMQNCKKIAISTTGRDIHFFDVSTNQHFGQFHLYGLPDVPNCMVYWYDKKNASGESVLIYGDTVGALGVLNFHRPVSQLFEIPFMENKRLQEVFVKDLHKHSKFVKFTYIPDALPDIILRLRYMPDSEHVITCSANENRAIVIYDIHRKKASYTFRIYKGCECFDYSKALNTLVTGSSDHNARLWNPYVPNKPTATLRGHGMGVIDVAIHERLGQIFTYSREAIIKVWDAKEHCCVQTVTLKLPGTAYGRLPDHGHFVFHLQPRPINSLLVGCNDYICSLKVGVEKEVKSLYPVSHNSQLCAAIYNPHMKQIITGCDDSSMAIWDLETGNRSILLAHAHGDEEITCMAFDSSFRRLVSGARNGTVKIWNVQNGHCIGTVEPIDESEVTGVVHLPDRKCFVTVGWSRQLTVYDDSKQTISAIKPVSWKSHHKHREDILGIAYCPPNLIATASFDGELLVWSTETERLYMKIRRGQKSEMFQKLRQLNVSVVSGTASISSSRPNSRHRKSHKPETGCPAPVDKLLFLPKRLPPGGRYDGAVLVTSEGGVIKWWTIFGSKRLIGEFYAPDTVDESVLAVCADDGCQKLVTGDTTGRVAVWDISRYCTEPVSEPCTNRPPLMYSYQTHDQAVVSVEHVTLEYAMFVVTASVDKSTRLWAEDGRYVGSFGQTEPWKLSNEKTWVHPKTPWTLMEELLAPKKKKSDKDHEEKSVPPSREQESRLTAVTPSTDISRYQNSPVKESLSLDDFSLLLSRQEGGASVADLRREKTSLGIKAELDFMRQREGRATRRGYWSGIDQRKTSRMNGKVCSPYHALSTPEVLDIGLPTGLPVTPRMLSKGYSPDRLDNSLLRNMDLKYRASDNLFMDFQPMAAVKLPLLTSIAKAKFMSNAKKGAKSQRSLTFA